MKSEIVGRLTRLPPAHSTSGLPVYVARRPPLHSVKRRLKKHWRVAQTPYKFWRQLLFDAGVYRNDVADQLAKARFCVRCLDLLATHKDDFHHLLSQMSPPFEDLTNTFITCPR